MDYSSRNQTVSASTMLSSALSNLPSSSSAHFSRLRRLRGSAMHPQIYVTTNNSAPPPSQVITTDNTNLLIRYISRQSEDKRKSQKRSLNDESFDSGISSSFPRDPNAMDEDEDPSRTLEPTMLVYPPHPKRQKTHESEGY